MKSITVSIAGVMILIKFIYEKTPEIYQDYLADGVPLFTVTVTRKELEKERENAKYMILKYPKRFPPFSNRSLEELYIYHQIAGQLPKYNGLLFHGSAVSLDGNGYLFTAPSGTGKSTHTRLWREVFGNRVEIINDDRPVLKIDGDRILVCGSPWRGKHRLGANISVPLKAICILSQAEKNQIRPIAEESAYPVLMKQSFQLQEEDYIHHKIELLDRIISRVLLLHLDCNMDTEAAIVSYEGIQKELKNAGDCTSGRDCKIHS